MRLLVDTHTHTTMSGHGFSTIMENLEVAASKGMSAICVTDHSGIVPGAQPNFAIATHSILPYEYKGVRIISGAEVDILDLSGNLDMEKKYYSKTSFLIASLHESTVESGTIEQNTHAMIVALQNPYVDLIGHPGNAAYPVDKLSVVLAAKKYNKLVEINNHSFAFRAGSEKNCTEFVRLCKQHDVRIGVGSDAHICLNIGMFDKVISVLNEENFPVELVVSATMESFDDYLRERTARIAAN